jgi:hypothetical protein
VATADLGRGHYSRFRSLERPARLCGCADGDQTGAVCPTRASTSGLKPNASPVPSGLRVCEVTRCVHVNARFQNCPVKIRFWFATINAFVDSLSKALTWLRFR